jgi:catechol 2,3-dioxygenase-like lactoylglutathione lyase family enzyme
MWGGKEFYFGDNISLGVRNLASAIAWYQENLGLRLTSLKSEDFDAFLALSKDPDTGLALITIPVGETTVNVAGHPILFTKKIDACRTAFASRGIHVRPLQRDSGGNSFFQFSDLQGNIIEVCVEP